MNKIASWHWEGSDFILWLPSGENFMKRARWKMGRNTGKNFRLLFKVDITTIHVGCKQCYPLLELALNFPWASARIKVASSQVHWTGNQEARVLVQGLLVLPQWKWVTSLLIGYGNFLRGKWQRYINDNPTKHHIGCLIEEISWEMIRVL